MKVYSRKKKRINIFALNVDEIRHFKEISETFFECLCEILFKKYLYFILLFHKSY